MLASISATVGRLRYLGQNGADGVEEAAKA
jgi:hypothetical protein